MPLPMDIQDIPHGWPLRRRRPQTAIGPSRSSCARVTRPASASQAEDFGPKFISGPISSAAAHFFRRRFSRNGLMGWMRAMVDGRSADPARLTPSARPKSDRIRRLALPPLI